MLNHQKGFIQNIVIIAVILAVVFLSQQPRFRMIGKDYYLEIVKHVGMYWSKGEVYFNTNILPKVSGEVGRGQQALAQEFTKQKNYFFLNVWDRIKSYTAGKFSDTTGTEVK